MQLSWRTPATGGAVNSYVVSAPGMSSKVVSSGRHSTTVDGLTNGVEYRFSVTARNRVGSGPEALANPVTPTGDVPGIPMAVQATANPSDGSVLVKWTPPLDQGPGITNYKVIASSANGDQSFDANLAKSLTLPKGTLTYGDAYAITVVAEGAATASPPSAPSQVTPYTVPDQPVVSAGAVTATSVTFTWPKPNENGKPLSGYTATVNGVAQQVTPDQTSLNVPNLAPGASASISLVARNEAGDSQPGAATGKASNPPPQISRVNESSGGYTQVAISFTVDWGAGAPGGTCAITLNGKKISSCTGGSATVPKASTNYDYKVVATSSTGLTANASGTVQSTVFTITNSCDNAEPGGDCGLGILQNVPQSDPDHGPPNKGKLGKGASASAECYGIGYQSQTGNQVDEHKSENGGKGRQSTYWIYIPNAGGGYVVGAYLEQSDDQLNNLPRC
ncbi:fibronectin type III domain-containing protein [Fodinicola feengrottensis]|uniref:fibronectin type III domain-containing protein n=1 Tax=Fodinicola feengrottensis TaxID=435914 RepID=UPI0013D6FB41|nr:fibronectin type III domain-containing protein [Fodinicola feengrottensis]